MGMEIYTVLEKNLPVIVPGRHVHTHYPFDSHATRPLVP